MILDDLITDGINKRYFPSVAAAVGDSSHVYYKASYGWSRVFSDDAPCFDICPDVIPLTAIPANIDTLYDMASLSKLISATMIAFKFIEAGKITLYDTIDRYLEGVPSDKRDITLQHLLTHTSGIKSHFHLSEYSNGRSAVETILSMPLSRPVGSDVEYTCMGYILLGKILEVIGGEPLDVLAEKYVFKPLGMKNTCYNPKRDNVAATEYSNELGKYICGTVHDENARRLNGISANAGVFSCIDDMIKFANMLSGHGSGYMSQSLFKRAISNHTVGMSESKGWGFSLKDNGLSSMGDIYAIGSYGHNGFTGTSLYVDAETGLYTILLTNRVHFTRRSSGLFRFRRLFHNAAITSFY